jgi:ABC-type multidrug transport system fused ATPase/permease subunit
VHLSNSVSLRKKIYQHKKIHFSIVGTFIMMIKLSLHLTIACLIDTPLILIVAKISGNAHRHISEKVQDLSADESEVVEETIRTVRSFENEDGELHMCLT